MEQHRVQRWALEWGMRSMVYWTTSSNPQREGTASGVEKMAQFLKDDSCSVKSLLPYKTCCIKLRSNFICISHESDEVVRLQRTYNSCHFCMLRSEIYLRADCWYIADISVLESIQECDFMQLGIECLILMRQVDLDTKHYMASEFRLGVFVITVTTWIMPRLAPSLLGRNTRLSVATFDFGINSTRACSFMLHTASESFMLHTATFIPHTAVSDWAINAWITKISMTCIWTWGFW